MIISSSLKLWLDCSSRVINGLNSLVEQLIDHFALTFCVAPSIWGVPLQIHIFYFAECTLHNCWRLFLKRKKLDFLFLQSPLLHAIDALLWRHVQALLWSKGTLKKGITVVGENLEPCTLRYRTCLDFKTKHVHFYLLTTYVHFHF